MGIVILLAVGLLAGWLTGLVLPRSGYGVLGNSVVGMVGSMLAGMAVGALDSRQVGFVGGVIFAFFGGCLLTLLMRAVGWRQQAWRP